MTLPLDRTSRPGPAPKVLVLVSRAQAEDFQAAGAEQAIDVLIADDIEDAYWKFLDNPDLSGVVIGVTAGGSPDALHPLSLLLGLARLRSEEEHPIWIFGCVTPTNKREINLPPLMCLARMRDAFPRVLPGFALSNLVIVETGLKLQAEILRAIIARDAEVLGRMTEQSMTRNGMHPFPPRPNASCDDLQSFFEQDVFPGFRPLKEASLEGYGKKLIHVVGITLGDSDESRRYAVKVAYGSDQASMHAELSNFRLHARAARGNIPHCFGLARGCIRGEQCTAIVYELVGMPPSKAGHPPNFASRTHDALQQMQNGGRTLAGEAADLISDDAHSVFTIAKTWWRCSAPTPPPADLMEGWKNCRLRVESLRDLLFGKARSALDSDGTFAGGSVHGLFEGVRFVDPIGTADIFLSHTGEVPRQLMHGDLHCGNVIQAGMGRDGKRKWIIIDFEDMRNHMVPAYDVASLECDLRFQCLTGVDPLHRYRLELLLAEKWSDDEGSAQAINLLTRFRGEPPLHLKALLGRLEKIRGAAQSSLWDYEVRAGPSHERLQQVVFNAACLIRSLEIMSFVEGNPDMQRHAWIAASLAASVVRRHVRENAYH